jgi:predicted metal-dependent phosphoesterase TrpH
LARVDLHVHSSASFDCQVPPLEVARRLMAYGMAPAFLTDHDTVSGARELEAAGVRTIVSQEVTTRDGELIGLFLEEPIEPGLSAEQAVARIKSQSGIVYLQHPMDTRRRSLRVEAIERVREQIDVVEVYNGRSSEQANQKAEDLCLTLGAVAGAGSDAHTLDEIGKVYMELADFEGPEDFLGKLEEARIVRHPPRWKMRLDGWTRGVTAG